MSSDEQIVRLCAWRARRYASPYMPADDAMQEARIALWRARRDGRVPLDAEHAQRYLLRRVGGAVIDAHRAEWRQRPPVVDDLPPDADIGPATSTADGRAIVSQALARLARLGSGQLMRCVEMLSRGASAQEAATELGVSPTRVSQLQAQARRLLAPCL